MTISNHEKQFIIWLNKMQFTLNPSLPIQEARKIFDQQLRRKQDNEQNNKEVSS